LLKLQLLRIPQQKLHKAIRELLNDEVDSCSKGNYEYIAMLDDQEA
jgi:hypothetical protein